MRHWLESDPMTPRMWFFWIAAIGLVVAILVAML